MFKIFHRGHKVQFNEDDIKKQEINKRSSYFYNTDAVSQDANEERKKANNLSVSSSNKKAITSQLPQTMRYSSVQNLQKSADGYDDSIDQEDLHGFKEKLMNRYTNVTTLLMRSFRKAKNKKKKEHEEKRKNSMDGEGSAAIYRPINRDEIVPNFDRLSKITLNQEENSLKNSPHKKENHIRENVAEDEDEEEDQEEEEDDNQDDEEDCNAIPVCVAVKSISNDFVDYPIKIGSKTLNTENNSMQKISENKQLSGTSGKSDQKSVNNSSVKESIVKHETSTSVNSPIKLIYNHSKPQAPVKPNPNEKINSPTKNTSDTLSRSSGFSQTKTPSKCASLIDERKKIFEANLANSHNIGSSNISLNKISYVGSLSKKTANDLNSDHVPKQSTVNANMMKNTIKNMEKANNGTTSMIMMQKISKLDSESMKSTLSIPGISNSSPKNAYLSNGLQKLEKNSMLSLHTETSSAEKSTNKPSGANVKRSKTFTQQLNEMLEQYKKMGSTNSITSNDKFDNDTKRLNILQRKSETNENNNKSKNGVHNAAQLGLIKEKETNKDSINKKDNYDSSKSSPTNSLNSNTIRLGETSKSNQPNSKIPININRIQATSNNKILSKVEQSSNLLKPSIGSPVEIVRNKYGIMQNSKESTVSHIKEAYLRSLNKNSTKILNEKTNKVNLKENNGLVNNNSGLKNTEKKQMEPNTSTKHDIYTNLKFPESSSTTPTSNPTNDKSKMYFQKFYCDMKDKMKKESYIQAISDVEDRQYSLKTPSSDFDDLNETRENFREAEKKLEIDITSASSKVSNDEFKSLVNVLDKQDVDFKLRFFNCLMPKLWDASLPYEEYVQLNKLMTALFGEKYHELDQSTRNLAEQLRRKSSINKYDLKEQFEKSQAYENSIKRLVKDYLSSKSPSKDLDEFNDSLDFNDIIDDEQSFKTVNHLINTLKRRQLKEYQRKLNNSSFYNASTHKMAQLERLQAKESSRSDYETYSDNAYSNHLHSYKMLNKHRNSKLRIGDSQASLFLHVKEQDDASEDTDYVSKQSDIWTQSFESSEKNDADNIYGTVNYRNKLMFRKSLNAEAVRDKLGISIQSLNQLKQEAVTKESLKEKIQAYNRISMNNSEKAHMINSNHNIDKIGYSPKMVRKNSMKRPSYPDIVIESTLDNDKNRPVVTSFQPSLNILTNQRISMSGHSINSENKPSRPKSPSNTVSQKLQAYRPKLLSDQITDISAYTSQEALNNSNNESLNLKPDRTVTKINSQNGKEESRKDYEMTFNDLKSTKPDLLDGYKSENQQNGLTYFAKTSRDNKIQLNSIKDLLKENNFNVKNNENGILEDTDFETIFNRKKSELMTKDLMNTFNDFFVDREIGFSNSKKNEPSIYDRFDIYDALY